MERVKVSIGLDLTRVFFFSVRMLHGRLEGDPRHGALLRPLLPGIHRKGRKNNNKTTRRSILGFDGMTKSDWSLPL